MQGIANKILKNHIFFRLRREEENAESVSAFCAGIMKRYLQDTGLAKFAKEKSRERGKAGHNG